MASEVQICNMALSHLGSEARVSSISPPDGSAEAGHCAAFYDVARTELLEPGSWAFSLKRAPLASVASDGLRDAYQFAYAKPSNCLRPLRIPAPSVAPTVFTQDTLPIDDSSSAHFIVEGEVIYTNQPDAVLLFVQDITDPTQLTPSFRTALSYLLASYLAGPIVKGNEGIRLSDAMRNRAMSVADISATASANASSSMTAETSSIVAARA